MDKMEEVNMLLSATITFLKFFIEQYEAKKIERDLFIEHTEIKIDFLRNNIDVLTSYEEKEEALNILRKCEEVYSEL